ncbi:hypothetical protein F4X90_22460 [Candidatus Poribacteria bacterium]|nr:hypothetical protein [Candidatus Poribacteria bacterium]
MSRIEKLLPILTGGAFAAANSLGQRLHSGKNSDQKSEQKLSQKQRKARNTKKRKRRDQKNSRRRNRR